MLAEIDFMSKTVTFIILSSRPGLFRPLSVTEVTDTGSLEVRLAERACHGREWRRRRRRRGELSCHADTWCSRWQPHGQMDLVKRTHTNICTHTRTQTHTDIFTDAAPLLHTHFFSIFSVDNRNTMKYDEAHKQRILHQNDKMTISMKYRLPIERCEQGDGVGMGAD